MSVLNVVDILETQEEEVTLKKFCAHNKNTSDISRVDDSVCADVVKCIKYIKLKFIFTVEQN